MILAHEIALDPNDEQETYFAKAAGIARFAYNWALTEWQHLCEAWPKPSDSALRKQLSAIKADQFPWMLGGTKNAPQMAIIHLGTALLRSPGLPTAGFPVSSWKLSIPPVSSKKHTVVGAEFGRFGGGDALYRGVGETPPVVKTLLSSGGGRHSACRTASCQPMPHDSATYRSMPSSYREYPGGCLAQTDDGSRHVV